MRISRSEERPYLRQDRIELGLLPFRQGGQDLIGFQAVMGISKAAVILPSVSTVMFFSPRSTWPM